MSLNNLQRELQQIDYLIKQRWDRSLTQIILFSINIILITIRMGTLGININKNQKVYLKTILIAFLITHTIKYKC